MDATILSASAIAVLTPYAKKATEEFAGEIGKAVFEKTKSLMQWMKLKFSKDPAAADVIRRFENEPDKYSSCLQDVLQERLRAEPKMANKFGRLVEEIKRAGPKVGVVIKMTKAEAVVGLRVKKMKHGKADVNVDVKEGKNITGADIEELG